MKNVYQKPIVSRDVLMYSRAFFTEHGVVLFLFSGKTMRMDFPYRGVRYIKHVTVETEQPSIEGQLYVDRDSVEVLIKPILDEFVNEVVEWTK